MKNTLIFLLAISALVACNKPEYYEKVEAELASGKRYDSLFLGLKFGMTSKEFYATCWDLNKQGILREGAGNMTAEYEIDSTVMRYTTKMNFFPTYHQDKIAEMPVTFHYEAWAPWNKHMYADSLQLDVKLLFEKWYGDGFLEIKHPEKGVAYVKIDGNRRISIYKQSERQVGVLFTDLLLEEELEKEKKKQL